MKHFSKLKNILLNKGAAYILSGSFFTKFVSFFGSIFVIRLLTKDEYGILGYYENIYSYAYLLAGFGLANAILRYVILGKSRNEKYSYYKYIYNKGTAINIFILMAFFIINRFYPHPDKYFSYKYLLDILILALVFQYIVDINLLTERALFSNKRFAYISFGISSILIISRILGGIFFKINGVIWSRVFVNAIFALLLTAFTYKRYFRNIPTIKLNNNQKKQIDIYSYQYMITNGLWAFFMLNDTFLLGIMCANPTVLAEYKVAYVLPGNVSLISTAIGTFICPYFVKHENDVQWIKQKFIKVYLITASSVGGLCLLLGFIAHPLIVFMYGKQYENIVGLMRLLLVAAFFNSGLRFTVANILAAMGQIKYNMYISFVGVVFQIILDILLIPNYGAIGVAYASMCIYATMSIALLFIFIKKYYIHNGHIMKMKKERR